MACIRKKGTGKTTIAGIIRGLQPSAFFDVSAITSGVKEIRQVTSMAFGAEIPPIIFIDEIHRFNKTQQDALLPFVENGDVVLIGVTTENPSFSINSPLLSRVQVIALHHLSENEIEAIIRRAVEHDHQLQGLQRRLEDESIRLIARAAGGDARAALNLVELALHKIEKELIKPEDLQAILDRPLYHDRAGDNHYDLISAFHKCVRASECDASLYWLGRMLEAGEDRLYVLRRMIRIASEDIGLADPNALRMVIAARDAFTALGSPEGDLALYEAAAYLACAPKSNRIYLTEKKIKKLIKETGAPDVPLSLRNAPTRLMKELGYGKGYAYAHDDPQGALTMDYLPASVADETLYEPSGAGFEKRIAEVIDARNKAKKAKSGPYRRSAGKGS